MTDEKIPDQEVARDGTPAAQSKSGLTGSVGEPAFSNWRRMRIRWTATRARIRAEKASSNSWIELSDDLAARLLEPLYSVSFLMYLFTGVVLLGGIAIWLEIVRYAIDVHSHAPETASSAPSLSGVMTAMHTFYPALAWSATMQIVYSEKANKWLKAFALTLGSVTLLMAVIAMAMTGVWLPSITIVVGAVGILIAIVLWWIANAEDPNLSDTLPQNIGMGAKGGPVQPNTPLPGSTQGFDFGAQP